MTVNSNSGLLRTGKTGAASSSSMRLGGEAVSAYGNDETDRYGSVDSITQRIECVAKAIVVVIWIRRDVLSRNPTEASKETKMRPASVVRTLAISTRLSPVAPLHAKFMAASEACHLSSDSDSHSQKLMWLTII